MTLIRDGDLAPPGSIWRDREERSLWKVAPDSFGSPVKLDAFLPPSPSVDPDPRRRARRSIRLPALLRHYRRVDEPSIDLLAWRDEVNS